MVPLPSARRPSSEEALKWGESLEKLLLHKCKWWPVAGSPAPGLSPFLPLSLPPLLGPRGSLILQRQPCPLSWASEVPLLLGEAEPGPRPLAWPGARSAGPSLSVGAGSAC